MSGGTSPILEGPKDPILLLNETHSRKYSMTNHTTHRCEVTAISPRCNYVQAAAVFRWTRDNITKDHILLQGRHEGINSRTPEEHRSLHL